MPGGMRQGVFDLRERGSTFWREVGAGVTTFASMSYILMVNPPMLADAGMPREAVLTATAVSAAVASVLMGLLSNLPLALAPGMGINAFFAYVICGSMGVPWQSALAMVFLNGILFLLLSVTGVRARILAAIPPNLKAATCAGIGIFIAFIGLTNGGLVVAKSGTFVGLGDLTHPPVLLFAAGILLACVLTARRIHGAILITIGVIAVVGFAVPDGQGGRVSHLPASLLAMPSSLAPTLFKLDFGFLFDRPLQALPVVLTLLLVDLFDNLGTLIGVGKYTGLMDREGRMPGFGGAMIADSLAAICSALVGTSTVVNYIESDTGIQAGGRTGLTAVVVAVLFLLALFLAPLVLCVPTVAVAPALVVVGLMMFESVAEIDMSRFELAAPAALTLMAVPLTFSTSTGIGLGLIAMVVVAWGSGRGRESLTPFTWALAAVFLLHFLEPLLLGGSGK